MNFPFKGKGKVTDSSLDKQYKFGTYPGYF